MLTLSYLSTAQMEMFVVLDIGYARALAWLVPLSLVAKVICRFHGQSRPRSYGQIRNMRSQEVLGSTRASYIVYVANPTIASK